jgi:hypothetical protein
MLNTINSELDILQCQPLNAARKKIKHFSPLEIAKEIDNNLNPKKKNHQDMMELVQKF